MLKRSIYYFYKETTLRIMKIFATILVHIFFFSYQASYAQINLLKLLKGDTTSSKTSSSTKTPSNNSLSVNNSEISSGLKQALEKSLQSSIKSLSQKDGFLGNQAVKVLLPPQAQKAEKALKAIGLGSLTDQLITSLNRAAESAVSEAGPVFVSALKKLTIADASKILLGGEKDAATTYFKGHTSQELSNKFKPIVSENLQKFDVSKHWNAMATSYNQIPLVREKMEADLNTYVTQKAIDGLFYQIAQEELKIRNNLGGSRTTPLLQKVFGYADKEEKK